MALVFPSILFAQRRYLREETYPTPPVSISCRGDSVFRYLTELCFKPVLPSTPPLILQVDAHCKMLHARQRKGACKVRLEPAATLTLHL